MDSVSHIRVAHLLMDYVEQICGVTFDSSGFVYGNLKPDLTGTYLTKRHNPSIMMDEVMDKIRAFTEKYTIGPVNGRELSVDLGEICHYITDFFTYPHNDDIYERNLLAHYLYEKRVALVIRRRMTEDKFEQWASPIIPPVTVDALIARIGSMHDAYRAADRHHGINDDLVHICRATAMVVLSIISIVYEQVEVPAGVIA
ncbi:MAG TPA: zinc dependent phospholipase C family protein [Candidatus Agathobaculum pullicola]|uniref:zinc dependent phospholipase C family protein n=1 Tax=Candidatus Agathobaculum pullicola TaxID=2838426 RepID=UPI001F9A52CA|nr:zinc dependent phospholipase C family protein [Candidatus Agathobaculum pullicola]